MSTDKLIQPEGELVVWRYRFKRELIQEADGEYAARFYYRTREMSRDNWKLAGKYPMKTLSYEISHPAHHWARYYLWSFEDSLKLMQALLTKTESQTGLIRLDLKQDSLTARNRAQQKWELAYHWAQEQVENPLPPVATIFALQSYWVVLGNGEDVFLNRYGSYEAFLVVLNDLFICFETPMNQALEEALNHVWPSLFREIPYQFQVMERPEALFVQGLMNGIELSVLVALYLSFQLFGA